MAEAQPIVMPMFGQSVEECTLVAWRKKEGDAIAKGEVIFEIETEKATLEVESFQEGTLLKIIVPAGGSAPVQTPVCFVGNPGDSIPEVKIAKPAAAQKKADGGQKAAAPAAAPGAGKTSRAPSAAREKPAQKMLAPEEPSGPEHPISPRARKLAREKLIDPAPITGTGYGGRVTEKDVMAYLAGRGYDKILISPAARKLAAKEKIDILNVRGTGDRGRIMVADIETAVSERPKPMSRMRQVIAERLTYSFTTTPHFYITVEVDMTDLVTLRADLKKRGLPYTVTDFIIHALVQTIREFPIINSTTDGISVQTHAHIHLGMAVSMDKGLVVPVIRNAETLTLGEIHDRTAALAAKARDGKLQPDEMSGGTFTISNMGMMDVENFTAIINPGEAAILAVSSTVKKPVVRNDQVVVRSIMKVTLSSDHRIIDGSVAAQFTNAVRTKLEDTESWKSMTL